MLLCQGFFFFAILGRGPRAFQIGKISVVKAICYSAQLCHFWSIESYYTYFSHQKIEGEKRFNSSMLPNPVTGALKVFTVLQRNASLI